MADQGKDEPIIELTEVVETPPGTSEGMWMETIPQPSPERKAEEPPRVSLDPPRPSLPNLESEMRAIREAMLARMEKWVAQEATGILERVAREVFPKIAEDIIRKEIEQLKAEAEEKE